MPLKLKSTCPYREAFHHLVGSVCSECRWMVSRLPPAVRSVQPLYHRLNLLDRLTFPIRSALIVTL